MDILEDISNQLNSGDVEGNTPSQQARNGCLQINCTFEISSNLMYSSSKEPTFSKSHFKEISDELALVFYTVFYGVISVCVCIFGIVSNAFNIIVFAKQGFQETVNVTLFAMAISDMTSLVTLLYLAVSLNPVLQEAELSFIPGEIQVLFGGWPHVLFLRITAWLQAFISIERCFCVLFPLKVKALFTLTKVKSSVVAIYILVTASMAPTYFYTRLGWRFVPEKNRTMLGLAYTPNRVKIESVSYTINSILSPVGYFTAILVSTSILVVSLNRKSKWRQKVASSKEEDKADQSFTNRDKKVVKMVVTIAIIFVVLLIPSNVVFVMQTIEPELNIVGKYQNLFKVLVSFTLTLEAVNSSVNALVYYNMSSNYRTVFRALILKKTEAKT